MQEGDQVVAINKNIKPEIEIDSNCVSQNCAVQRRIKLQLSLLDHIPASSVVLS